MVFHSLKKAFLYGGITCCALFTANYLQEEDSGGTPTMLRFFEQEQRKKDIGLLLHQNQIEDTKDIAPVRHSLFIRKKDTPTALEQQKQHFDKTIPSSLLVSTTRHDLSTPIEGFPNRATQALANSATTAKTFSTKDELRSAINEYCNSPDLWKNNSKFNDYGAIEDWDVSQVNDMSYLFRDEQSCNPPIARWNVTRVTNFSYMFQSATNFNQDIGRWNVSNGVYFWYMFKSATNFNQDIGGWNVSNGVYFNAMFQRATNFNQDIGRWDVSKGERFNHMFNDASAFNKDIGGWNVSKGWAFSAMFESATNFNQDIGRWDVSNGVYFSYMYQSATNFNQDIGGWNVSKGWGFSYMFQSATNFNQDIGGWDVSEGQAFSYMFNDASSFNQNLCTWDMGSSTSNNNFCSGKSCGDCFVSMATTTNVPTKCLYVTLLVIIGTFLNA